VAEHLKDVDLLLKAATRAFEIMPKDPVVMNNYAAALLIHRQRPDEVIKLTLQLFSSNPNSLHAVVNHSAAMLLNDRPKEAEVLLARVSTNNLNRGQMALYNLDLFETYSGLRQYDRAWAISDRIETNLLYPTQQKWFAQARSQLPPKTKPK
jgi:predicted Zn-dependent protease